jgi:cytoskeletal protein CcmA (bactofilin family)
MWKQDESVKPSGATKDSAAARAPADVRPGTNVVMDLGKSVVIKGELSASEDLTLYGQMEGKITLPDHTLTIAPHADIKAAINANAVVILGAVTGNVTARERVEIQTTGSVAGDVTSPRLAIADGGSLSGTVQMPQSAVGKSSTRNP